MPVKDKNGFYGTLNPLKICLLVVIITALVLNLVPVDPTNRTSCDVNKDQSGEDGIVAGMPFMAAGQSTESSNAQDIKTDHTTTRADSTITTGSDASISTSFGTSGNENLNIGGDADILISYNSPDGVDHFYPFRTLVKFDVTSIPTNADISSAILKLYYYKAVDIQGNEGTASVVLTIKAHQVTRSWVEGTGTWVAGGTDGATWNTYDGSNSWSSAGGDYVDSSTVISSTPTSYGWVSWEVKEFVEGWITGAYQNHGLLFICHPVPDQPTLKYFRSFNSGTNAPKLEITYQSNEKPVAVIDSISPNPARELSEISFSGHGTDEEDGTADSGFLWTAKKGAGPVIVLGNAAAITADNLTQGTYIIGFQVQDSEQAWSEENTETLVVEPDKPPAKIKDLAAEPHGWEDGAVNLTWTAVAEDDKSQGGKATSYIIKYSDGEIQSESSFEHAKDVPNKNDIPDPGNPGSTERFAVEGLTSGEQYFFAIVAVDAREQNGELSKVVSAFAPDHKPPGKITDLKAFPGEEDGEVELTWTATGDDDIFGRARSYSIKYSEEEINDAYDFDEADNIPNHRDVQEPDYRGEEETFVVEDLDGGTTYYFALITIDESGNAGSLSDVVCGIATDLTAPPPIIHVTAMDTPNDEGKSITASWEAATIEDFDHYAIFVSRNRIGDVESLTPDKTVNNIMTTTAEITTVGAMPLSDWTDYYVAVTAVDEFDNQDPEVASFGPVKCVNNLDKPQPLLDPKKGETYSLRELTSNKEVGVEMTKVNVSLTVTEINSDHFEISYLYVLEGTTVFPGDRITHIDIYTGVKDKKGDLTWSPLMDMDKLEDLDENDPDYLDKFYGLFINPDIVNDEWSLNYQYTEEIDKDDFDLASDAGGMIEPEYTVCAVAWSETFEWNSMAAEHNPKMEVQWKFDSDDDDLGDGWEEIYFTDLTDQGAKGDPDGDGYSNLLEYQKGTDPTDAEDHPTGSPDIKAVEKGGWGGTLWLIIVIAIVLFIGTVIIIAIVILKKKKEEKEPVPVRYPLPPQGSPVPPGPPGPPPQALSRPPGPPSPPHRAPTWQQSQPSRPQQPPVRAPHTADTPEKPTVQQPTKEEIQRQYRAIQQQAMEVRTKFSQAQDPGKRKVLEQEYHVLEQRIKELQQMAQGPERPPRRVVKKRPVKEELKGLPTGDKAQLALPRGQQGDVQTLSEDESLEQAAQSAGGGSPQAESGELAPTLIECHVCGTTNLVSTAERPVIIECSSCGEKGYLET